MSACVKRKAHSARNEQQPYQVRKTGIIQYNTTERLAHAQGTTLLTRLAAPASRLSCTQPPAQPTETAASPCPISQAQKAAAPLASVLMGSSGEAMGRT